MDQIGHRAASADVVSQPGATTRPLSLAAAVLCVAGLVIFALPSIDIGASAPFNTGKGAFYGADHPVIEGLRSVLTYGYIGLLVTAIVGTIIAVRLQAPWLGWRAPQWLLVASCLIVGPGLVANTIFKDNWGRARPREIVEFGGTKPFTRPLLLADNCESNCSFVSGEASSSFMMLYALAAAAPQYAVPLVAAGTAIGLASGLIRISQGGHFLSDVLFAGMFMALTALALRWLLLGKGQIIWRGAARSGRGMVVATMWTQFRAWTITSPIAAVAVLLAPFAVWIAAYPRHDLAASALFYIGNGRFSGMDNWLVEAVRNAFIVGYFALCGLAILGAIIARRQGAPWLGWTFPRWTMVAACLVIGPGLIANLTLKQNWGRPRPTQVAEFNGKWPFVSALNPGGQCPRHCSFVSGEASSTFVSFYALAAAMPQYAVPIVAVGTVMGLATGLVRMIQGAHFLSDVIFAGVFMALTVLLIRRITQWAMGRPKF
jgi:lipid A 4'-phosphatase